MGHRVDGRLRVREVQARRADRSLASVKWLAWIVGLLLMSAVAFAAWGAFLASILYGMDGEGLMRALLPGVG